MLNQVCIAGPIRDPASAEGRIDRSARLTPRLTYNRNAWRSHAGIDRTWLPQAHEEQRRASLSKAWAETGYRQQSIMTMLTRLTRSNAPFSADGTARVTADIRGVSVIDHHHMDVGR